MAQDLEISHFITVERKHTDMTKKHDNSVDIALYAFLYERVFRNKYGISSIQWEKLRTVLKAKYKLKTFSQDKFDYLFRDAFTMTQNEALAILEAANLTDLWEETQNSSKQKKSGVFDASFKGIKGCKECDLDSAIELGLTIENICEQMVNIDAGLFNIAARGYQQDISEWVKVAGNFPDTWRIWVDARNEILAYWFFVTPTHDYFNKGIVGEYPEHEIILDTLAPLKKIGQGKNYIYGPGMYVRKDKLDSTNKILNSKLILSFRYHLKRLRLEGIEFEKICVPIYTKDSYSLLKHFPQLKNGRMPDVINEHYARNSEYKNISEADSVGEFLPAIYLAKIDDELAKQAGI